MPGNRTAGSFCTKSHISQSDCINLYPQDSHEISSCFTSSSTFNPLQWRCGDSQWLPLCLMRLPSEAEHVLKCSLALWISFYHRFTHESSVDLNISCMGKLHPQPASLITSDTRVLTGLCLCVLSPSHRQKDFRVKGHVTARAGEE